tara:strand:- start:2447 stop:3556 length:1110 start_codon:yes stop_codon:yes gene_type:complete
MMKVLALIFLTLFSIRFSFGDEVRYLVRSPKALLLGDAYTAVADDEYVLFYNPAALGFNKGIGITLANVDSSAPNLLKPVYAKKLTTAVGTDVSALATNYMGLPINTHLGLTPTAKMRNWAISFFVNHTTNFNLKNATHPVWGIDLVYDRGMILGGAFDFKLLGMQNAFGLSIKAMNRRGFTGDFYLLGPTLATKLLTGSKDLDSIRQSLGDASSKTAYGFDIGWMAKKSYGKSELSLGASIMDVFDTQFTRYEGTRDLPNQEMLINTGLAWSYSSTLFDYRLSFDIHPINETLEFMRRFHIGLNIGVPLVDVMFGWNGGYLSYGLSANALIGKVTIGLYGIETGTSYRQLEASRFIAYWSFIDFKFGN